MPTTQTQTNAAAAYSPHPKHVVAAVVVIILVAFAIFVLTRQPSPTGASRLPVTTVSVPSGASTSGASNSTSGGGMSVTSCGAGDYCMGQSEAASLMTSLPVVGYSAQYGTSPAFISTAYKDGGALQNLNFSAVSPNVTGAYIVTANVSQPNSAPLLGMIEVVYLSANPKWIYDTYVGGFNNITNATLDGLTYSYFSQSNSTQNYSFTSFEGYKANATVFLTFELNQANATQVAQIVSRDIP